MFCKVTGRCVFIGEPRKFSQPGKPDRVCKEFAFLVETPKEAPQVVKVISWNGFAPKLGEPSEFGARVGVRQYTDNRGKVHHDFVVEAV